MDVKLVIKQRRCRLIFGSSPCTADTAPKCYNTRTTCKDVENIDLGDQDLIFTTSTVTDEPQRPFKLADGTLLDPPVLPSIESCVITSGALELEGIASQNTAQLTLVDEPTNIEYNDAYQSERNNKGGSVWGRVLSRNRTLNKSNAILSFRETADDAYTDTNWVIGSISYPTNGRVKIQLIDPLTYQLDRASLVQKGLRVGRKLTKTVHPRVTDEVFPGAFYRIDKELLQLKADRTWLRGARGTDIKEHDANAQLLEVVDIVQPAASWQTAFKRVVQRYFPNRYDDADSLKQSADITGMRVVLSLYRPEKISEILATLAMAGQCAIYFDIFSSKLKYRVNYIGPASAPIDNITENETLVLQAPAVNLVSGKQVTQVVYTSNLADPLDDKSYQVRSVSNAESLDGELLVIGDNIENQYSRSGDAVAARRVQRYGISPLDVKFMVNAADFLTLWIGDSVTFTYNELAQGYDGSAETVNCIIDKVVFDVIKGHKTISSLSINRLLTFSQGTQIIGPGGVIIYEQKIVLSDVVENVNLYNLAGQPVRQVILNVEIEDNTIIGGTVVENQPVPAFVIDLFPQDTIINIDVGRNVRIVGAAGRGGSLSNTETSLNRAPVRGGDGLIIGGDNSKTTKPGQPRFIVNWKLNGNLIVNSGGGGGGAGSTYDKANEDIGFDEDAGLTSKGKHTALRATRASRLIQYPPDVNKGGDGAGYAGGGIHASSSGTVKCDRVPYMTNSYAPTRGSLQTIDLRRWLMGESLANFFDKGNWRDNNAPQIRAAGLRGSDTFVYYQTAQNSYSKRRFLQKTRHTRTARYDFVITTGQGGGGGSYGAGGGAGGRRQYTGNNPDEHGSVKGSFFNPDHSAPFNYLREYVPDRTSRKATAGVTVPGVGEIVASSGSSREDFRDNEQSGADGGMWYRADSAIRSTTTGGSLVFNVDPGTSTSGATGQLDGPTGS